MTASLIVLVMPSILTLVLQVLLGALIALQIYEHRRAQKLARAVGAILDELRADVKAGRKAA